MSSRRGAGGEGGQGRQNVPGRPTGAQDGHQGQQPAFINR